MTEALSRATSCLVAGSVGDALGSPSENLEPGEIAERWGWLDEFEGSGTDDTFLRDLLCRALIETDGYAGPEAWASQWLAHGDVFRGPLRGRFFVSVLQTFTKLSAGYPVETAAVGNLASSSSAMCISPVGIVNAGRPSMAAAQARSLGSLIHVGDVSYCVDAAAAVAALIAGIFTTDNLDDGLEVMRSAAFPHGSKPLMVRLIDASLGLARHYRDYDGFRSEFHARMRCPIACDSRETVPAAIALAWLAEGDPRLAVEFGANFGRDTDTIAAMAGAITGALTSFEKLPVSWSDKLGQNTVDRLAGDARILLKMGQNKVLVDQQELTRAGLLDRP